MRGGGKHKDKKNKVEKIQAVRPKCSEPLQGQLEQKYAEELESDKSPVIQEYENDEAIWMIWNTKCVRRDR